MSKNEVKEVKKQVEAEVKKPTLAESIEDLKTQLKEYQEKAEYFKNMTLKASGALEVLSQIVEPNE